MNATKPLKGRKTHASDSELAEVPVGLLKIGMYVAAVDKPWLETPFAVQGFFVETEEDIDYVAAHCQHVYVDPRRVDRRELNTRRYAPSTGPRNTTSLKSELRRATVDYESASVAVEKVFTQLKKNRHLDAGAIESALTPLIQSVLRNSEAMAALIRMKQKNDYIHSHCISTAVWSILLGRHVGLDNDELKVLALGAAMIDVGMVNVPNHIINKPGPLTAKEFKLVKSHVKTGVRLVEEAGTVNHRVIEIIACHHERHSGSGYPNGLAGADIPLTARMAGIADSYDAMITQRPYASARSSFDAIQELTALKGSLFHPDITEAFTQAIGIFPTGSIVELNSGEVGIVVGQNSVRRLKPQIIVVLDKNKVPYKRFITCDLQYQSDPDDPLRNLRITKELQPGTYGLDAQNYFL
ncbi:MAG: HD-GYP domain-containing protein [Gammaproteobacteria bacterium]|nr:HD-GYP domain-containing protein [Gammaproteobacteria bacterium]